MPRRAPTSETECASGICAVPSGGMTCGGCVEPLLGALNAWGLAHVDSTLGVASGLTDGRAAFRPISLSGEPLSAWVCLDDSAPDQGFSAQAAIANDGEGFEFVVRMTDGSATYLRTDQLGMMR